MLLYIANNSQKEALKETLQGVKQASIDEEDDYPQEISPNMLALQQKLRNNPPKNKRKGRNYLSQYSFDSMDEDFWNKDN